MMYCGDNVSGTDWQQQVPATDNEYKQGALFM